MGAGFLLREGGEPGIGGEEDILVRLGGVQGLAQAFGLAAVELGEHAQDGG